jgi:pyruvate formate lyase activating enzyme
MTVEEIIADVARDRVFYDESGGGVTFSGGEPFAQSAFLLALLRAAREAGLSTAVDTCGFVAPGVLLAAAALVDLFLYDLKGLEALRHREIIGLPLKPILDNLDALGRAGARVWLRIPIVPAFTDDPAALEEAARLAGANRAVERVHLLPYHPSGTGKFRRLGRPYALDATAAPSASRMAEIADIFRSRGIDTRIGG